jgi:hypothetical protein
MKNIIKTLILFALTQAAFAGHIECSGSKAGHKINLKGKAPGIMVYSAVGTLAIDGIEEANFHGDDMKWDVSEKSFVFSSDRDDKVIGKFDNYMAGLVTVSKLEIRGKYNWDNVKMKCKTN